MSVSLRFHVEEVLKRVESEDAEVLLSRILTLFDVLKHGEDGHKEWLGKAIENHFLDLPMPEYVAK